MDQRSESWTSKLALGLFSFLQTHKDTAVGQSFWPKIERILRFLVASLALLMGLVSAASAIERITAPGPLLWSDYPNAVRGAYPEAQGVCDERHAVINWYKPLTFRLDPAADWKGFCESERGSGWFDVMGYPFRGQQCPTGYSMINYTDSKVGPNGNFYYGQAQYCQLATWPSCPMNSSIDGNSCKCNDGFTENAAHSACLALPLEPAPTASQSCKTDGWAVGNPIIPFSGDKQVWENDNIDVGKDPLNLVRLYRSSWGMEEVHAEVGMGKTWTHGYNTVLVATPANAPVEAVVTLPEGYRRKFAKSSPDSSTWSPTNSADSLTQTAEGGWTWLNAESDTTYSFDATGRMRGQTERNGRTKTFAYNTTGRLATITNAFGQSLAFGYDSAGFLTNVSNSNGLVVGYSYDANGRLTAASYPDGSGRAYLYENATYPNALTTILDETGGHWKKYVYDTLGRATSTELAGGVGKYLVTYSASSSAEVQDPLGTYRTYRYSASKDRLTVKSASVPPATGYVDANFRSQDANGLVISETDFKGVVTTTTWDVARRLPTTVVHASGTADARTVTTQWHPIFSLPALVIEPGRTTAYAYDAFGNTLSKTITDTATNKAQLWQWTYNAQQLASTAGEPNGAVTSYTYDTRGNVLTSTNTLGHVTSYAYDAANRVVATIAPNGLVATYTYDLRGRLLTQTIGGQTTTLTYKLYGTVETITLPTGLVLTYSYDAAHRLTGWSNNRGESGIYTLDGMGNRTAEQIKDSAGNIAWNTARTINYMNRLSAKTEGLNQTNAFGYDANGELTRTTNGLDQSTNYSLDNLRRIKSVINAASASATLKYNALDAVTEAKDFKGVVTAYGRDAQGNATTETSTDTGTANTQYDNLGLPSQITDALGQATTITRDALGRPTGLVFADGKTTTLRYDLTANSKGYLSEIIDRSGTTEYTRDAFGRVTLKKQTLINGSVQQVSYAYNASGRLASIGYPNGGTLSHVYDSTGRLTGLNWNGTPLVNGIAWNPLGQPTAWSWAFASPAIAASRAYDTAGRLTNTEFSSYVYDAAGRITSLTQNLYQPGDSDPTHNTIASGNTTWSVGYNAVGRIVSFNATGNTAGFGYDSNGNRASSTRALNGQTTSRIYTVGATSNRLTGFSQTINGASSTIVSYGYNANGDMVTDGLRSYAYDAEGRLAAATTGATDVSPTTRYAHNALGQRVFKTEPLYPPSQGDEADPGFMQSLIAFFTKLWSPATTQAEQLGYAYVYDEQGTLIAEVGSGGTNSAGQSQYIYLPTANGPMPIAAIVNSSTFAVHSDHLNTPRKLTNADGQAVWQWGYSAFGEDKPTLARNRFANPETTPNAGSTNLSEVKFNLRYPGQYADEESGLFYNGFRSYSPTAGRYTQGDPIGLDGGWNRFGYVSGNPLMYTDPLGLWEVADIFPDGAPIVTIGRSLGGVVAYGEGRLTGNDALADAAMEGLQCSRAENMDALGIMLSMGRSGKQSRLRDLASNDKLGSADRGWLQQEINAIARGNRSNIRNPPGKDLAHERGREAAKGYDYNQSNLQDRDLHKLQHKYDDYGRANAERPLPLNEGGIGGAGGSRCGCP